MPEKTPAEKLHLKSGMTAAVLHPPGAVPLASLGIPEDVRVTADPAGADFILDFAETQSDAEARIRALAPHVADKTVAWFAYPKGSKAAGLDISRDTLAAFVRTIGLVAVSMVAIDPVWSAARIRPLKPGE